MNTKYQIGDRFTLKNTRDSAVLEVQSIDTSQSSIIYNLRRICFGNSTIQIPEETLTELYRNVSNPRICD